MPRQESSIHGLLVIDKPPGMTSREVVDRALRWLPRGTRTGHTGTLDPLATGVLVLCLGLATRFAEYVQRMDKVYRTRIRLGATSDTDDADGTIHATVQAPALNFAAVEQAVHELVGDIDQIPPAYSAAKLAGRRAYDLARKGEAVHLESRRVRIYGITILGFDYPTLDLEIHCGKGTYIRSLARDLGNRLGCGGLVETLRRTRVGPFKAADGVSLEAPAETALAALQPISLALADLPRVTLTDEDTRRLQLGQMIPLALSTTVEVENSAREVVALDAKERLLGVALVQGRGLRPLKMLPTDSRS